MHHGPGRADGVGKRHAHGQPALGEPADDFGGQSLFAAKQMRKSCEIQEQTIRPRGIFQSDDRAEAMAPIGQLVQCDQIGIRIGGLQMRLVLELADSRFSPACATSAAASASGMPG